MQMLTIPHVDAFNPSTKEHNVKVAQSINLDTQNVWVDILNINKAGFINAIDFASNVAQNFEVMILIDGQQKFYSTCEGNQGSPYPYGIFKEIPTYDSVSTGKIFGYSVGYPVLHPEIRNTISTKSFPNNASVIVKAISVITTPIYFNNSLQVKVRCITGSSYALLYGYDICM